MVPLLAERGLPGRAVRRCFCQDDHLDAAGHGRGVAAQRVELHGFFEQRHLRAPVSGLPIGQRCVERARAAVQIIVLDPVCDLGEHLMDDGIIVMGPRPAGDQVARDIDRAFDFDEGLVEREIFVRAQALGEVDDEASLHTGVLGGAEINAATFEFGEELIRGQAIEVERAAMNLSRRDAAGGDDGGLRRGGFWFARPYEAREPGRHFALVRGVLALPPAGGEMLNVPPSMIFAATPPGALTFVVAAPGSAGVNM